MNPACFLSTVIGIVCAKSGVRSELQGAYSPLSPTSMCPSCRYLRYSHTLSHLGMGKDGHVDWGSCLWAPLHLLNQAKSLPWKTSFLIASYWAKSLGTDVKNCEVLCDGAVLGQCYSLLLVHSDGHLLEKEISVAVSKPETQNGDKQWFMKLWTLWRIHIIFGGGKSLKDLEKVWPSKEWCGGHAFVAEDGIRLICDEETFQRREGSFMLELVPYEKEFFISMRKLRLKNVYWYTVLSSSAFYVLVGLGNSK